MVDLIYKEEAFEIIGICMEVHRILGKGLLEIVYKDALEYEFKKKGIPFSREKKYPVKYKDVILPHSFNVDFVVRNKIILEAKSKSKSDFVKADIAQTINYLRLSNLKLGLLVNFGITSLEYKRIVL
ncbi:MAG: GxxExxY protein [Melioribacteraceae bacterium]|jgi:GxxExxY protein|nr:GxxExxY protein [Melioribacteraceae bacterium]